MFIDRLLVFLGCFIASICLFLCVFGIGALLWEIMPILGLCWIIGCICGISGTIAFDLKINRKDTP